MYHNLIFICLKRAVCVYNGRKRTNCNEFVKCLVQFDIEILGGGVCPRIKKETRLNHAAGEGAVPQKKT
jgi:hypothetical protein